MDHVEAPLLAELNLPAGAHVVVAGAYKGDTVRFLLHHHPDVRIRAYEPQAWALAQVPDDARVAKLPYALCVGDSPGEELHHYGTDAASFTPAIPASDDQPSAFVMCIDAVIALAQFRDEPLSLLVLNVEGYEYELIPYLLDHGIIPVRLLVQYHHYKTHRADYFAITAKQLATEYAGCTEVGKGWWYYD